jgi:hypothetical protein
MADYAERIANEWREQAPRLAAWVLTHLVNRTDVWGRYVRRKSDDGEPGIGVVTAPFRDERGKVFLDLESLEKHFKVRSGSGVLGVHSASSDQTSRWLAIDIDRHDIDDLAVTAEGNFVAARSWWQQLAEQGFDPLLLDSNGQGGYHILVLFAQPMATKSVHEFGKRLTADYRRRGLDVAPEIFPGQARWDHYGDWLRLPGRHHTRSHYSRVWNDEPFNDNPWLEGHEAIERILATRPADLALAESQGIQLSRRTVCLDFDGVLHSYRSGWCGADVIPDPPVHGTRDAVARLRETYRVVVHSARCHTLEGRQAIAHWLARHGIEVDEICEHKPPAVAYVDDRAIPFRGEWEQLLIDIRQFRR